MISLIQPNNRCTFFMNNVKLNSITYWGNENICEWDFVEPVKGLFRVYFKPDEEIGSGFKYYVVEWTSNTYGDENWGDSCCAECLFKGVARFDGMRHHYMGDEQ